MKQTISVILIFIIPMMSIAEELDKRNVLCLDSQEKATMLNEMRNLLVGLQTIQIGLANDDFAEVGKAAHSLGMGMTHSVETHKIMQSLPMKFRKLGMSMHADFDQIAKSAEAKPETKKTLQQLGEVLDKCIGCHATYKVVEKGQGCN